MTEFWKQPKFWATAVLILWLGYIIGSNLEQIVVVRIVPGLLHPMVKVSTIVMTSMIFGVVLTLVIQFMWRRGGRPSKIVVQSPPAPGTSSSTVA
jgi:Ca2+/Na+ antiporter